LNMVVIGGGPTGVELAGTLAEITRHALAQDFRAIDPTRTRILLIEAGPRVLAAYPEDLSASAEKQLQKLGVEVRTGARVTDVAADHVRIGEDEVIPAAVILWGAGVKASPLGRALGAPVDRAGRVLVNPDCSVPEHPNVFVVGDLAAFKEENGKFVPGVAPAAIQQGEYVARLIADELRGRAREPFHYFDKGSLATIGRAAAVADFGRVHLSGFIAWLGWLFVHILFLIGFRNRVMVLINWAYSFFTFERGARLITGSAELPSAHAEAPNAARADASEDKNTVASGRSSPTRVA
jgi:NADH:ubiquinone reductase (H+-translocating)